MNDFIEKLREKAVFFKLTSKPKYGGAVSLEDVLKVFKSLVESYHSFVDIEYEKINTQVDKTKIRNIKSGLSEENNLIVVDLKFESYGMAISPNTITYNHSIPDIKNILKWKSNAFETYKDFVLDADFNNEKYLQKVKTKYNEEQRQRIYKPLIDGIANNERAVTKFGFGSETPKKTLKKPREKSYNILVPNVIRAIDFDETHTRTSMALVEIKAGKAKPKILELFEQIQNPVFTFTKIEYGDKTYSLKYPIYCELIHEGDSYSLENKQLGIYAFGKTVDEAKLAFEEEFDYIFDRYNSLKNDELSTDVVTIKQFLNLIVN